MEALLVTMPIKKFPSSTNLVDNLECLETRDLSKNQKFKEFLKHLLSYFIQDIFERTLSLSKLFYCINSCIVSVYAAS